MSEIPHTSDEGSDVDIEEVEVLNPLDLSVEDVYENNTIENSQQDHGVNDENDHTLVIDDNQDNIVDEIGSESDSDNLEIEDGDDGEPSVVIENLNNDDNFIYSSADEEVPSAPIRPVPTFRKEGPVNGFQEAFNLNLVNHGASTSSHVQGSWPRRKVLHRLADGGAKARIREFFCSSWTF